MIKCKNIDSDESNRNKESIRRKFRGLKILNLLCTVILISFCIPVFCFNIYLKEQILFNKNKVNSLDANIILASNIIDVTSREKEMVNPDSDDKDKFNLYIIMYHSVQKDDKYKGRYIIPKSLLEKDIKYLKSRGYNFINVRDLIEFVYDKKDMVSNPIMLTFDDGHYNFKTNVVPLLEKYDAKATVAVVGEYIFDDERNKDKNDRYSYLDVNDLVELSNYKNISIINHSYSFHKINESNYGAMKTSKESDNAYVKRFLSDTIGQEFMFEEYKIRHEPFYAYPYGGASSKAKEVVKEIGLLGSFSCVNGINVIERTPNCLYDLKRYNRPYTATSEEYFFDIFK